MDTLEMILLELQTLQARLEALINFKVKQSDESISFFAKNNQKSTNLDDLIKANSKIEVIANELQSELATHLDDKYKNHDTRKPKDLRQFRALKRSNASGFFCPALSVLAAEMKGDSSTTTTITISPTSAATFTKTRNY